MVNLVEQFGDELEVHSTFPHQIEISTLRIPLSDGVELAARLWVPISANTTPVPAIMEYIPYRQRDYTFSRDALLHPWFAGHGYAALRVDLRGSGDSTGLPMDEYVMQEQDDAVEVLAWIADQPWCSGVTGMIGISWGGFNALQVAARRPPSLKAIVSVCSTDDRYTDDVHYLGGCLLSDNFTWGSLLSANMARPPDPLVLGESWREEWLRRLEFAPLAVTQWLSHQRRDDYWKHGSVCESYADIECAVYAIGGWADSYTNAIPRLMSHLKSPRRGLIGPWVHAYPHLATPAPRVGFLQEATRWWDRWLKEIDNGIDKEPMLKIWVQDCVPPAPAYTERAGDWVEEDCWPPAVTQDLIYYLNDNKLETYRGQAAKLTIHSGVNVGAGAGGWMALGVGAEMPSDQRLDDGNSLVFDRAPLEQALTLFGQPTARLHITSNAPIAQLAVRLNDVFPDGRATRVTYGILNLTHRDSHESPAPLEPGVGYHIDIVLKQIAQTIPVGHRVRLALLSSYWPMVWPSPNAVTLHLDTAKSHLNIPLRASTARSEVFIDGPAIPSPPSIAWTRGVQHKRTIVSDVAGATTTLTHSRDEGAYKIEEHGMEVDACGTEQHWIKDGQPLSAGSRVSWRLALARGAWKTLVECELEQTATAENFLIRAELNAYEADTRVFTRASYHRIPRDLI